MSPSVSANIVWLRVSIDLRPCASSAENGRFIEKHFIDTCGPV